MFVSFINPQHVAMAVSVAVPRENSAPKRDQTPFGHKSLLTSTLLFLFIKCIDLLWFHMVHQLPHMVTVRSSTSCAVYLTNCMLLICLIPQFQKRHFHLMTHCLLPPVAATTLFFYFFLLLTKKNFTIIEKRVVYLIKSYVAEGRKYLEVLRIKYLILGTKYQKVVPNTNLIYFL